VLYRMRVLGEEFATGNCAGAFLPMELSEPEPRLEGRCSIQLSARSLHLTHCIALTGHLLSLKPTPKNAKDRISAQ
jgi:hypothetical protein